jgi:RNA polymerase sigma-70 factor, ECF subfamily
MRTGLEHVRVDGFDSILQSSDPQLVTSIARGDEQALAEAYRRHGGVVLGLARRVTNDAGDAQDVTQEVLLNLWRHPERFDASRGSLRTYLLTQAHGRAVDLVRSSVARYGREERDARRRAHAGYDVEREVWDLTVRDKIDDAMSSLPEGERVAIELAYFGGHTYREVAILLCEPEGTVKSRIRFGLRRLRQTLIGDGVREVDS